MLFCMVSVLSLFLSSGFLLFYCLFLAFYRLFLSSVRSTNDMGEFSGMGRAGAVYGSGFMASA